MTVDAGRSRVGAGIAYYGGMHPEHAASAKRLLGAGIPVMELRGCAYPEMARAEIIRSALEARVECVLIIEPDAIFTPEDARTIAEYAMSLGGVVTASWQRDMSGRSTRHALGPDAIGTSTARIREIKPKARPWDPNSQPALGFAAIPLCVIEKMAASEEREYTNSAVIDTGFSKASRPFFSPWTKAPGTLLTPSIEPGMHVDTDVAFLMRAARVAPVYEATRIAVRLAREPGYFVRYRCNPDAAERRKAHGIERNYCVCVPTHGSLDIEQQDALWELEKAGVNIVELHGCPYIDLARAELTRIAIDELGSEGLFFLDSDIIFKPIDAINLMREAHARQDVVAAVYCMRKTAQALIGAIDVPNGTEVPFFEIGEVMPALYSGLGFAAIPRAVIDSLRETFPALEAGFPGKVHPLYALDTNGNYYSGEDVSFCARVQGLTVRHIPTKYRAETPNAIDWELTRTLSPTGHRVWLDTRVRIMHKGTYHYGIEDHSFCVPRYSELRGKLTPTREEARQYLRAVDTLSADERIRCIGLDEGAESPHDGLKEAVC